ncbi:MAG: transcription termination/antitermination NusG family protein [Bryobacteraceae bacterium]|jgi:transcription antitermination factor NusG
MSGQVERFPWYALRVLSNHEKPVSAALMQRDYPEFLPMYRARRRWSDRYQDVDVPLFPGYVFCRLNVNNRLPVLVIPGVMHIVGVGKVPVSVDEHEIASIQAVVSSGMLLQPWPFLKVGQTVRIEEGPLRNVQGILTEFDGSQKLILSITLLQRSLAVSIPRHAVRPAEEADEWRMLGSLAQA